MLEAAKDHLAEWGVRIWYVDGSLPCLDVYGISDSWPHVQRLVSDAGFDDADGHVEIVFAGDLDAVPPPEPTPPVQGISVRRVLGTLGTSFEGVVDGEVVGMFEVEDDFTKGGSIMGLAGWADVCNHRVSQECRGRGIGTWLFRHGCEWLRLGGSRRLLAYAWEDDQLPAVERYLAGHGLTRINRTRRGWVRQPR